VNNTEGPDIATVLEQRWDAFIGGLEGDDSWVGRGLLVVARLARAESTLGGVFPFQSLNRLCFSRCSDFPYTNDLPCIGVGKQGEFGVDRYPYSKNGRDEPDEGRDMGDAGNAIGAADAIAIAVSVLPRNASDVWLGTSDRHDSRASSSDS
jgi:hypothetical protein